MGTKGDPLFFELDKQKVLFPTLYMLWKCPQMMGGYFMTTFQGVLPKLQNGADLMMPGVVSNVATRGIKAFCDGKLKKVWFICLFLVITNNGSILY